MSLSNVSSWPFVSNIAVGGADAVDSAPGAYAGGGGADGSIAW